MRPPPSSVVAALLAVTLLPLAPATALAADPPVTLRLATPENADRPSQVFLDTFASSVEQASAGTITVDLIFQAGGGDDVDKEGITAQRVLSGDVEMGMIPVRAWGGAGVTVFDALSAPLLIDNDELAVAVSTDPLLQPLLDAASEQGIVGLAAWPEDLRHPFTFERNGPPLLAPDDFAGQQIHAIRSTLQAEILGALGATVVSPATVDQGVINGTLRGAETGLWVGGRIIGFLPTATADVTLYPKWQTLVAEDAAWSRLSAEQQTIIRDGAAAAQAAYLATRPTDVVSAKVYCEAGGIVVTAGRANVDAFRAAVQPVVDRIAQDPLAAAAIAAIQALKDAQRDVRSTPPCRPPIDASATPLPVEPGLPTTLIPDGVYVLTVTKADLIARGTTADTAGNNEGDWTLSVSGKDGFWSLRHPTGHLERCDVTFKVRLKDRVRMAPTPSCPQYWTDLRWRLDGDQLWITVLDDAIGTRHNVMEDQAIIGGPWTKIE